MRLEYDNYIALHDQWRRLQPLVGPAISRNDHQMQGASECLECTRDPVTIADWERFKVAMLEHYGVAVGDKHLPVRFRT